MKREPWNPLLKTYPQSLKINAVSIGAEAMFCRLLALCDDHANYYADAKLLMAHLFGHRWKNGTVSLRDCARWRNEIVAVELAKVYAVDGEIYLHIVNCKKMLRSDIKQDIRFPAFKAQLVVKSEDIESVTNTGRVRNGFGSSSVSVAVSVEASVYADRLTATSPFLSVSLKTARARAAFLRALRSRARLPVEFLVWWFRERVHRDQTPLSNLKAADRFARALVKAVNLGRRKPFEDLRHLVESSVDAEEPLPPVVMVGKESVAVGELVDLWKRSGP